jgi:hypothetical protein
MQGFTFILISGAEVSDSPTPSASPIWERGMRTSERTPSCGRTKPVEFSAVRTESRT